MHTVTFARTGITAAVAALGLAVLAWLPPVKQPAQYKMVDDLLDAGLASWGDAELKVHGWVEAGSLGQAEIAGELHQTFVLQKAGRKLRVLTRGPLPDVFRDQAELVVTGHLVAPAKVQPIAELLCPGCSGAAEAARVLDGEVIAIKCVGKYGGDPRAPGAGAEFK